MEPNLELARRGYEAWNQGDTAWFEQNMTDDIEILPVPELFPDVDNLYRGLEGWAKFWAVFRDAWSSIDIEVERIEALSDDEVFAIVRFDGVGRESGVEVSLTFAHWLTFRDGKLARLKVEMHDERPRTLTD